MPTSKKASCASRPKKDPKIEFKEDDLFTSTEDLDSEAAELQIYEKERDILSAYRKGLLTKEDLKKPSMLKVEEIAYDVFEDIIRKKEEMNNRLINASYTRAYKCYKCGGNQTSVVYVQTRSSDEPMTAFIRCVKCQHQFRN